MNNHDLDKKYFEMLALKLLEEYLNIDISNFVDSEKPDWKDFKNSIGIEVTRHSEGTQFWSELEKVKAPISDKKIEKFNKRFIKNGGSVITRETAKIIFGDEAKDNFNFNKNYFYIIPGFNDNFSKINEIIENKVKLLNTIYDKNMNNNRLFIFSPVYVVDEMIMKEVIDIENIQKDKMKKFDIIYICLLYKIYVINLNDNNFKKIVMNKNRVDEISNLVVEEIKLNKEVN